MRVEINANLKFRVVGEAKPWEVILDALEQLLGSGLRLQLARRQSAPQDREMRDFFRGNVLRFDPPVESFEREALGKRDVTTQTWGFHGWKHGESFFLCSPKGSERGMQPFD